MLTPPVSMRIFLAAGVTDLRKSFGGLSAAVESVLSRRVLSGDRCARARALLGSVDAASLGLACAGGAVARQPGVNDR